MTPKTISKLPDLYQQVLILLAALLPPQQQQLQQQHQQQLKVVRMYGQIFAQSATQKNVRGTTVVRRTVKTLATFVRMAGLPATNAKMIGLRINAGNVAPKSVRRIKDVRITVRTLAICASLARIAPFHLFHFTKMFEFPTKQKLLYYLPIYYFHAFRRTVLS